MGQASRVVAGSWKFSLLPSPPRLKRAQVLGFWARQPFGNAEGSGRSIPFLWGASAPVEIAAPGFKEMSFGRGGTSADQGAGACRVRGNEHAVLLRREDAKFKAIDLHPKAYESSRAMGCSEKQQVGYGTPKGARVDVALLWSGSAESVVELRASDPKLETTAYAIANGVQVGCSESAVELHPKKVKLSECHYTDGAEQVGVASVNFLSNLASLWHGSADSWVDLTPKNFPGGAAYGCASGMQAGCVALDKDNMRHHAALWAGSAASFVDLHDFVPKQDFSDSCAWGLLIEGGRLRVVGEVSLMKDGVSYSQRAALWEATFSA
jgi:hypothetical protein